MMNKNYTPLLLLAFIISFNTAFSQEIEWADKILSVTHIDKEYENNNLGMTLGPPVLYSEEDYRKEVFDEYSDGYIIHHSGNRRETVDFGFSKVMNANQLCIAGILNMGVVKKAFIILRNEKEVQVYSQEKNKDTKKFHTLAVKFSTETIYGIRFVIDHSKVNSWNLLKGVGIYLGSDEIKLKPDLFTENAIVPREKVANINSNDCADFNPKLSADGNKLYFVRDCENEKSDNIFYAESNGIGNWNAAMNIGKPLNNGGHNFVVSSCLNPKVLYMGNTYKENGESAGIGLSKTTLNEEGTWSIPKKIEIPFLDDKEYINYCVNFDETAIFIVVEDKKNTANTDLYVSTYNKYKRAWEVPVSLGPEINTEFAEDYPYISTDGNTLFFCSNGRMGYGGYDIYVTKKEEDSWTSWSKPKNLGPGINSKTDDISFAVANSGDVAYLSTVSTDTANHNVDIYRAALPKGLEQPALTSIKGKIISERSNEPVNATVRYREVGTKKFETISVYTDKKGNFSYVLPHGKEYEVDIQAPNYFRIKDKLSLNLPENKNHFSKNYFIRPFLDSGQVSVINTIFFEFGNARIKPESFPEIDKLVIQLREQNKSVVEIAGHTDDFGPDTFNLRLSRWRAGAIVDYLVSKGIKPWRLKINGYGENAPIASNETEDGRALNRRVEMTILEDDITKKYKKPATSKEKKPGFALKKNEDNSREND